MLFNNTIYKFSIKVTFSSTEQNRSKLQKQNLVDVELVQDHDHVINTNITINNRVLSVHL